MNGAHIRELAISDLYQKVSEFWPSEAEDFDDGYRTQVLGLVQERLKYFKELPELTLFFFADLPINPELISSHKQLKKLDFTTLKNLLEQSMNSLKSSDFSTEDLSNKLNALLELTGQKPAVLFSLIRIATTQAAASPGLAESLKVLGKERSLSRIQSQINNL